MHYTPQYRYLPPVSFHFLTPLYDAFCTLVGLGRGFREKAVRAASMSGRETVLDIGCGTGVFLAFLKEKFPHAKCIGIDPDERSLRIASGRFSKHHIDITLHQAFAEALPLADGSIDLCFSSLAFHHMPDDIKERGIGEIYRILKEGGRCVIADFGERKSRLYTRLLFFEKFEYIEGNRRGLILEFLRKAGFKDIRIADRHFYAIDIVTAQK